MLTLQWMDAFLNPAWHALVTRHASLSSGGNLARRYHPDIVPIAAVREWTSAALNELVRLFSPGEKLFLVNAPADAGTLLEGPERLRETRRIPCHQMFFDLSRAPRPIALHPSEAMDTEAAAREMIVLTDVAFPGFFRIRSPRMGPYRGIRAAGQLVAMAGIRLSWAGHREVSAVCTHPEHTGRGYAQQLVREIADWIRSEGDTPMLHVSVANARARAVYERLGFVTARQIDWVQFERTTD